MKTLILVRHAKSSWSGVGLDDFDRPLNDRGKRDAPEMAKRLLNKNLHIDLLVSSPAKRAKKTATLFAQELNYDTDNIVFIDALYLAGSEDFLSAITACPDSASSVVVFSHNPGITEFANSLTDARIDDMPTCAAVGITIAADRWSDFEKSPKKFLFFDYPKSGQD